MAHVIQPYSKTKYMVVSTRNRDRGNPDIFLNGTILEKVRTYPQLGLMLNEKLNGEDHGMQ